MNAARRLVLKKLHRYGKAGMPSLKNNFLALCACIATVVPVASAQAPARAIHAESNPILSDGEYYSADPAPLVADGRLYILAGRDEAPADVNDFIMKEWQLLETADVAGGNWTHHPSLLGPEQVFA